jgi:hypothetical protein
MWEGGEAAEIVPPRSTSRLGRGDAVSSPPGSGDAVSSDRCPGRRRRNDQPDRQRHNEKRFTLLTCGSGAPGRTRTCHLRIRSEARPVCLVASWGIAAGRFGSVVRPVRSWPRLLQRPDCQRDCQTYREPAASIPAVRQVVADYKRLSAVQGAGRAGDGRASRPQYPGLTGIARTRNRWPGWASVPGPARILR